MPKNKKKPKKIIKNAKGQIVEVTDEEAETEEEDDSESDDGQPG
jgi:hypothetical protein